MRVHLVYLGQLKESVGRLSETVDIPEGSTLRDLLDVCQQNAPSIADFRKILAYSINYEYAGLNQTLKDGDEVALLPPVSGGVTEVRPRATGRSVLHRDPIQAREIIDALKRPDDGAVSVFDGIVRNNTRGRQTMYLVYEAYEEMALREMERLCLEAISRFGVRDARIHHRLGRLEVGETSVLIVVASAHRRAALDACRFLIDTLKQTVPIWKKEFFVDGAVWADGEPFPEEIRGGAKTES